VGLANDLLKKYEANIECVNLYPSSSGRFEVQVNDTLVYSKLETGRHAEPGEIIHLLEEFLKK
jgi:selenoprotein W-related protein